jgi:hypothetical protein
VHFMLPGTYPLSHLNALSLLGAVDGPRVVLQAPRSRGAEKSLRVRYWYSGFSTSSTFT